MQQITSIEGLSCHTNIEVYQCSVHHNSKNIILYDDHRSILNVLFEVKKLNLFSKVPNLIFFDRHDDACNPNISAKDLLEKWNVKTIEEVSSRDFWSFVEFDLGGLDDDWLLAGMELDLINHAVVIGQKENSNIKDMNFEFKSTNGILHEMFDIPHLNYSLDCRGCLGDSIIKEPYYKKIRDVFEYNRPSCNSYEKFSKEVTAPFVLDFDLDCFTTDCEGKQYAWPEMIFKEKYYDNENVRCFMQKLISRSEFITICREPSCCGGLGESNKILGYLDKYFFNCQLHTKSI